MTQQGARQAAVRAATGTALTYEGDWHALFDQAAIAAGPYNQRLLAWINAQLGATYAELNGAMAAYAASQGAPSWSAMGAFSAGGGGMPNPPAGYVYLLSPQDGATYLLSPQDGSTYLIASQAA